MLRCRVFMNIFISSMLLMVYALWSLAPQYAFYIHSHPGENRPHIHRDGFFDQADAFEAPNSVIPSSKTRLRNYYSADIQGHAAILGYLNSSFIGTRKMDRVEAARTSI